MLDAPKLNIAEDFSKVISNRKIGVFLFLLMALSVFSGECMAAVSEKAGILETVLKWLPLILTGFLLNLLVSVVSMTMGTIAGVFWASLKCHKFGHLKNRSLMTQFS
jgi:ABC-type amino acid transport system permease subunit